MKKYKIFKISILLLSASFIVVSCTKLNENLNSTLNQADGNKFAYLALNAAYNDIGLIYVDPGNEMQLQEVSGDECVVPIRGTDWADGGYHVQLKLHNWTRNGPTSGSILEGQFTALNKLNYDATTATASGSPDQIGQAKFIRAIACYQLLDLFGQFPLRQPGEDLLKPAKVYSGDSAVQFLISELNFSIANLSTGNPNTIANVNAARLLLMKVYLGRGAFNHLANPVFADADLQQVITLGTAMGAFSPTFEKYYFDIFSYNNSTTPEAVFALPNKIGNTSSTNPSLQNRWYATLHYNSFDGGGIYGQAGWNGFSTLGDFYNTFGVNGTNLTQTSADTTVDDRIGGRFYKGVTDISGLRAGILIGQQYNEAGQPLQDRKNNPLSFRNGSDIPASVDISSVPAFESDGYRVLKYTPDFTSGAKGNWLSYKNPGNSFIFFRYSDALLMVAEAKMRLSTPDNIGALALVNTLRVARHATPLTSMTLVNTSNVYDPNTLLAERGRELYWENMRRTDLIRFGVFGIAWRLKPADGAKYFVFPMPQADLNANPNLLANIQGTTY
jgi:hypothetical protein